MKINCTINKENLQCNLVECHI